MGYRKDTLACRELRGIMEGVAYCLRERGCFSDDQLTEDLLFNLCWEWVVEYEMFHPTPETYDEDEGKLVRNMREMLDLYVSRKGQPPLRTIRARAQAG